MAINKVDNPGEGAHALRVAGGCWAGCWGEGCWAGCWGSVEVQELETVVSRMKAMDKKELDTFVGQMKETFAKR